MQTLCSIANDRLNKLDILGHSLAPRLGYVDANMRWFVNEMDMLFVVTKSSKVLPIDQLFKRCNKFGFILSNSYPLDQTNSFSLRNNDMRLYKNLCYTFPDCSFSVQACVFRPLQCMSSVEDEEFVDYSDEHGYMGDDETDLVTDAMPLYQLYSKYEYSVFALTTPLFDPNAELLDDCPVHDIAFLEPYVYASDETQNVGTYANVLVVEKY